MKKYIRTQHNRGFTLIELLVVISIISLLSSIVMASLNTARSKARDTKRTEEVRQIQTALAMYYDTYGYYPRSGECGATQPNAGWSNSVECLSNGRWLRDSLRTTAGFIAGDPVDPLNKLGSFPREAYYYYSQGYGGDKQWYMLLYGLENYPNPQVENNDGVTTPNGTYFHYGNDSNGIITVGVGK